MNRSKQQRHRDGLSNIEVIVSTLLVSIMIIASLDASTALSIRKRTAANWETADRIAQTFEDEIRTVPFVDVEPSLVTWGAETGETTRGEMDDVDDYDRFVQSPPTDRSGQPLAEAGWSIEIAVESKTNDPFASASTDSLTLPLRSVSMTIQSPDGLSSTARFLIGETGDSLNRGELIEYRVGKSDGSIERAIIRATNVSEDVR